MNLRRLNFGEISPTRRVDYQSIGATCRQVLNEIFIRYRLRIGFDFHS